ncbi:MAG: type II CAAX endopeptidase family protein [Clostridia bacterium]|nr:type II CAAX endopeptidase family protein [Clostridia bacterium]
MHNEIDFSQNDIQAQQNKERYELKQISMSTAFICLVMLAINFVLSICAVSIVKIFNSKILAVLLTGIITLCSVFLPTIIGSHFFGGIKPLVKRGQKKQRNIIDDVLMIVFGFGACVAINYITGILSSIFPFLGKPNGAVSYGNEPFTIGLTVLVFAILPAVCEEFAFRGVIMGIFGKYGDRFAIIVSAFIFGMLHSSFITMIFAFCSGIVFGLIRKNSGSLVPSMIVHFLNNLISVIMACLDNESGIEFYYIVIFVSAVMLMFSFFLIYKRNSGFFSLGGSNCSLSEKDMFRTAFLSCPSMLAFIVISGVIMIL